VYPKRRAAKKTNPPKKSYTNTPRQTKSYTCNNQRVAIPVSTSSTSTIQAFFVLIKTEYAKDGIAKEIVPTNMPFLFTLSPYGSLLSIIFFAFFTFGQPQSHCS
jgi:hypothetical protein